LVNSGKNVRDGTKALRMFENAALTADHQKKKEINFSWITR
jgi:hypothetical protein